MTKLDMKTRIFIIISFLLLGSLALATTKYVIQPSGSQQDWKLLPCMTGKLLPTVLSEV